MAHRGQGGKNINHEKQERRDPRKSREASENHDAFLASYSLKRKAGSKKSFSAKLCVLCASAVKKEKIATAEAQSTQSFAEKKEYLRAGIRRDNIHLGLPLFVVPVPDCSDL